MVVGALLAVVVGGALWWVGTQVAPVATGYAAKIVCSAHFVSGRSVADARGDLPDNPVAPLVAVSVDEDSDGDDVVTATLLGIWRTTARHTPGYGCTLADERPAFADDAAPAVAAGPADALWPDGSRVDTDAAALADRTALDEALGLAFSERDVPQGAERGTRAVVVVHDGRIVAERYAEGFDADTPLLGWSMAKSVASALVGRLVGAGRLDVDDRALLDRWSDDERAEITLRDLLHMASGLAFEEVYDLGTTATEMLFTPGSTVDVAARQPLEAPPGTRWSYSSGTTNIICEVARRALDAGGPGMVRTWVFEPLGMSSAVMEPDASGLPVCSSFLYATARDWARFGLWFLDDGVWQGERLLPEGWVEFSTAPVDLPSAAEPYGAQWWLNEGADGRRRLASLPADTFWASGNEGQQVVIVPGANLVVVRLGLSRGLDGLDWGMERVVGAAIEAVGGA